MIMKTQEQLKAELYAPLPAEAIKQHPTKTFLSTIKPIYITDRLNEVFGIGKWQTKTENVLVNDNGTVVNKTTLIIEEYGIYYECFGGNDNGGSGSKGFDLGDAFKGATTDALNKIASYLGIGIDVYRGKQSHQSNGYQSKPAPAPAPALQPNTSFAVTNDNVKKLVDAEEDRKAKALDMLKKVKAVSTVKGLIAKQKEFKATEEGKDFVSGATVDDAVKLNSIELVGAFYKFVK
jgi:hypothetical protein